MPPFGAGVVLFAVAVTCAGALTGSVLGVSANAAKYDFAVTMDAGSTGTRVFIYEWKHRHASGSTAPFSGVWDQVGWSAKVNPGISSFVDNPEGAGESLRSLVDFAKNTLIEEQYRWERIPIFLKATAGMRVITDLPARDRVMNSVRAFLSNATNNPFFFEPMMARVISGEEEGVFGWLAVNYLNGLLTKAPPKPGADSTALEHPKTVGALDMGGASTQITFQPPHDVLANYFPYYVKDRQIRLYTHSFLYYGYVEARRRVLENIIQDFDDPKTRSVNDPIPHFHSPCDYTSTEFNFTYAGDQTNGGVRVKEDESKAREVGREVVFRGSGDHTACVSRCRDLLHKDMECWSNVCSFSGVYQPRFGNHTFYAFSAYGRLFESLDLPMNFTLNDLYRLSESLCGTPWQELKAKYYALDPLYLKNYCFLSTYMYVLMAEGYELNRDQTQVRFQTLVDTRTGPKEVTWTLGAIIYEANTYPFGKWDIDEPAADHQWIRGLTLACALLAAGWAVTAAYQHHYWSQRVRQGLAYESLDHAARHH